MPKWSIDIIRKKCEHLGVVDANTQQEAYRKAIEEFAIPPERQNRIIVSKLHDGEPRRDRPR